MDLSQSNSKGQKSVSLTISVKNKAQFDEGSIEYKIQNLKSSPLITDGSPGKVSHHAGCLVIYKNNKALKPVSLYDRDSQKPPPPEVMQYEGIYVFGGKDIQGEVMGNLYVLTVGKRPLNWINLQKYIDNESSSPSPRFGHCMHYCSELNFVVLFGGRNDSLGQADKSIFNDIWILKLNVLNWINVKCYGDTPNKRYGFVSALSGTQLIIFGGLDGKKYNSASIYA
jgi:hypothetical protein